MSLLSAWLTQITTSFHKLKEQNLDWQQQNQYQIQQLNRKQALAEQELLAELSRKSAELAHQLKLLETENTAELAMLKTKCAQDVKDYQQYLDSLEQLKLTIQRNYHHLPAAVAFTIHHHAKQLLNKMWQAPSFSSKMALEMQLIQFMTAVHEDVSLYLENPSSQQSLPEKTLALMEASQQSETM